MKYSGCYTQSTENWNRSHPNPYRLNFGILACGADPHRTGAVLYALGPIFLALKCGLWQLSSGGVVSAMNYRSAGPSGTPD